MSKKNQIVDTDYLYATTRVRALERSLLSRERLERMLEARSDEEATKVLIECGYDELSELSGSALDETLAAQRAKSFDLLGTIAPDERIVRLFRLRYDYHNLKALLKADAIGQEPESYLSGAGTIPLRELSETVQQLNFSALPEPMGSAADEARNILARTGDPQLLDFELDQAYYKQLLEMARAIGSAFLLGFVRLQIDAANLRSVVRAVRMGRQSGDFLRHVLVEGGAVDPSRLSMAVSASGSLEDFYAHTALAPAAELSGPVMRRETGLTEFERLCDNALTQYLRAATAVAFGEQPLCAYIWAKESEITAVRIVMSGRLAGVPLETIRTRVRETYL